MNKHKVVEVITNVNDTKGGRHMYQDNDIGSGMTEHALKDYFKGKKQIPKVVYVTVSGPITWRTTRYFEDVKDAMAQFGHLANAQNLVRFDDSRDFVGEVPVIAEEGEEGTDIILDFEGMSIIATPLIKAYEDLTVGSVINDLKDQVVGIEVYAYPGYGEPTIFNTNKEIIDFTQKNFFDSSVDVPSCFEVSKNKDWASLGLISDDSSLVEEAKIMDFGILDEVGYNHHCYHDLRTVAQFGGVDFASKYGDKNAKVLVIIIDAPEDVIN